MTDVFPFDTIRPGQDALVKKVKEVLSGHKSLLAHAPTGIGKTAAVLSPALEYALENKKRVLFVTPRHSQHRIAIETLKRISERCKINFNAADIIGRQGICSYAGADKMPGSDFMSFCAHHVKGKTCVFRNKTFSKEGVLSKDAERAIRGLVENIMHVEDAKGLCSDMCPYEILMRHAKASDVIIADYFHAFHPQISPVFFAKTGLSEEDCILVVDEAHNAAPRIRSMCSTALTSYGLELAKNELAKAGFKEFSEDVAAISESLEKVYLERTSNGKKEAFAEKADIISAVEKAAGYGQFIEDIEACAGAILNQKRKSFSRALAGFLSAWSGTDDGFARIVTPKRTAYGVQFSYAYHCLDPAKIASEILNGMHSSILMSGTLFPAEMHEALLGLKNAESISLGSPFPKENRLDIVVPDITSKYSERTDATYGNFAKRIAEISASVPGNIGVYFPSYEFRDRVSSSLEGIVSKPLVFEEAGATKDEKERTFKLFASKAKEGALLLAVVGAGFSEGVDFPGELMNAVVVAGMPLERPDLLTNAVITYYDKKFGRGWDFGYTYPAINRAVQAAGRCIRSETDRGIIFFLDSRFLLPNYRKAMPQDIKLKPATNIGKLCSDFFGEKVISAGQPNNTHARILP